MELAASQRCHSGPQTRRRTRKPCVTFCSGICQSCPKSSPNDIMIPATSIKVEPVTKQEISSPQKNGNSHSIGGLLDHCKKISEDTPCNPQPPRHERQRQDPRFGNKYLKINLDASKREVVLRQLQITNKNSEAFLSNDDIEMPEETNIVGQEIYTPCIDKVGSLIFKYFDIDNLLNCRTLSKSWRQAVDTFLEDPSHKYIFEALNSRNVFNHQTPINNFSLEFSSCTDNPFIGKCATFSLTVDTIEKRDELQNILESKKQCISLEQARHLHQRHKALKKEMKTESLRYWRHVEEFLSQFGSKIWYLTIKQHECGLSPCRLYEIIQMCLGQTPNLKTLVVKGHFEKLFEEPKTNNVTGSVSRLQMIQPARESKAINSAYYKYKLIMREHNLKMALESESLAPLQKLRSVKIHLEENVCNDFGSCDTQMVYDMYKNKVETLYSSVLWKDFELLNEIQAHLNLLW